MAAALGNGHVATEKLALAQRRLRRVQDAWDDPTDWDDLYLYGFYALEAAIDCACLHLGESPQKAHWSRADAAQRLPGHGLDDVSDLLRDLNEGRKSIAYGDVEPPALNAEETAAKIEGFIDSVARLLEQGGTR